MEDKNRNPSLPSNYVTLAQLQERWLKQKEKEKQLQEEQQQKQQQQKIPKLPQHNPREYHQGRRPEAQQQAWRPIPAPPTGLRNAAVKQPPAESGPKKPNIPESNRVAVEVSRETNGSVEAKADIGDGNDGQDDKEKRSKEKRKSRKRKPRAHKEKQKLAEDATESTMVGNKEVESSNIQRIDEKTEAKIESDGSKSNDLMTEVEQKLGTISVNSKNEKQNGGVKTNNSSRGSQRNNRGRNHRTGPYGGRIRELATESTVVGNKEVASADFQRIDEKTETKIESDGSMSNDLMMEVEQKLGTLSVNSQSEKQNGGVKTNNSSRGSQRNNRGRNHRTGPYGGRIRELARESTVVGNKEVASTDFQRVDEKTETKIESDGSKSNDLMMEVDQKLGTISMKSENEKQNSGVKAYNSSRGSQRNNRGRNHRTGPYDGRIRELATESTMVGNKEVASSDIQRMDEKTETKIESDGSKSNDLMTEVEQKLGTISMSCENLKQNSGVKTHNSSRGSQRNNSCRNHRTGPYGGVIRAHEVQWRRIDQKIWVKKGEHSNGNVDHNEMHSE